MGTRTGALDENTCSAAAEEGIWKCCSGRVRMGARGTRGRARPRRGKGTGGAEVGASEQVPGTRTCSGAAEGGHLEVLQWARENGCPWDSDTCDKAAGKGHLEVLKWARQNGCPWDK